MGITSTQNKSQPTLPIGSIIAWPAISPPAGWLLCNGQTVSRTTYAELFAIIGTTFGVGDGSTTFTLPDLRGRTWFGLDNMSNNGFGSDAGRLAVANTLGLTGGAETHTLTTAELAVHAHGQNLPNATSGGVAANPGAYFSSNWTNNASNTTAHSGSSTQNNGSGAAHNNMPPYMLGSWAIRATRMSMNIDAATYSVATSGAKPAAEVGRAVYTTDTNALLISSGASKTYKAPWNLPWGMFPTNDGGTAAQFTGVMAATANQASITSGTDITGLSLTFTPVVGRRYMYFASCEILPTVADGAYVFALCDGSNNVKQRATGPCLSTGASQTIMLQFSEDFGSTASVTRKMRLSKPSGSGSLTMAASGTAPAYMHVIDMGPISGPS